MSIRHPAAPQSDAVSDIMAGFVLIMPFKMPCLNALSEPGVRRPAGVAPGITPRTTPRR